MSKDHEEQLSHNEATAIQFLLNTAMYKSKVDLTLEKCKGIFEDKDSEKNVNIDIQVPNVGINLLMIASQYGKEDIVQWLLTEKKAKVDLTTTEGNTALHCACSKSGNEAVIKLLSEHENGKKIYVNDNGRTPLDIAKEDGGYSGEIIELLERDDLNVVSSFIKGFSATVGNVFMGDNTDHDSTADN